MATKISLAISIVEMMLSLSTHAAQPTDMDGAKTANGKVVVGFIETLFNQHKGEQAFDNYVSHDYLEHGYLGMTGGARSPEAASNSEQKVPPASSQVAAKLKDFERNRQEEAAMVGKMTKMHLDIKKVVVQGDLVFVQAHGLNGMAANGDLMWILYRVKNGKITEHWDTHNAIPDDQVNKQW